MPQKFGTDSNQSRSNLSQCQSGSKSAQSRSSLHKRQKNIGSNQQKSKLSQQNFESGSNKRGSYLGQSQLSSGSTSLNSNLQQSKLSRTSTRSRSKTIELHGNAGSNQLIESNSFCPAFPQKQLRAGLTAPNDLSPLLLDSITKGQESQLSKDHSSADTSLLTTVYPVSSRGQYENELMKYYSKSQRQIGRALNERPSKKSQSQLGSESNQSKSNLPQDQSDAESTYFDFLQPLHEDNLSQRSKFTQLLTKKGSISVKSKLLQCNLSAESNLGNSNLSHSHHSGNFYNINKVDVRSGSDVISAGTSVELNEIDLATSSMTNSVSSSTTETNRACANPSECINRRSNTLISLQTEQELTCPCSNLQSRDRLTKSKINLGSDFNIPRTGSIVNQEYSIKSSDKINLFQCTRNNTSFVQLCDQGVSSSQKHLGSINVCNCNKQFYSGPTSVQVQAGTSLLKGSSTSTQCRFDPDLILVDSSIEDELPSGSCHCNFLHYLSDFNSIRGRKASGCLIAPYRYPTRHKFRTKTLQSRGTMTNILQTAETTQSKSVSSQSWNDTGYCQSCRSKLSKFNINPESKKS